MATAADAIKKKGARKDIAINRLLVPGSTFQVRWFQVPGATFGVRRSRFVGSNFEPGTSSLEPSNLELWNLELWNPSRSTYSHQPLARGQVAKQQLIERLGGVCHLVVH